MTLVTGRKDFKVGEEVTEGRKYTVTWHTPLSGCKGLGRSVGVVVVGILSTYHMFSQV